MNVRTGQGFTFPTLRWQDLLFIVAAMNFVACGIVSGLIGGDALSGHSALGHYYLNNHGRLKEVAHATFLFSQVYMGATSAFFITAALFRGLVKKQRKDEQRALARRVRSKFRWQS